MDRTTPENGGAGLSEPRRGAVILRTFELERQCHLVQKTGRDRARASCSMVLRKAWTVAATNIPCAGDGIFDRVPLYECDLGGLQFSVFYNDRSRNLWGSPSGFLFQMS